MRLKQARRIKKLYAPVKQTGYPQFYILIHCLIVDNMLIKIIHIIKFNLVYFGCFTAINKCEINYGLFIQFI